MNPFRRQLIEQAFANVGDWITPIQTDSEGEFYRVRDPTISPDWSVLRMGKDKTAFLDHHANRQVMAAGLALGQQVGFEDQNIVASNYRPALLLPSIAAENAQFGNPPKDRIQLISDWIDQHPYAAPRMKEVESAMARDALAAVAQDAVAQRSGVEVSAARRAM